MFFFSSFQGKPIDFIGVDESTSRWVQDFNVKPYATPAKLESIDGEVISFISRSFFLCVFLCCLVKLNVTVTLSRCPISGAAHPRLPRSAE